MATLLEALASVDNKDILHVVPVSGGKDSAALAVYLRQKYPQIPAEYVFCDTDAELPETHEFLERLEALLGKRITRINALDYADIERKPNRSAFDFYYKELYSGFLPSPQARWCTRHLKIIPFEKFVGDRIAYSYIGIRADEDRAGYIPKKPPVMSSQPNIRPVYPFKDDRLMLQDIKRILEESGLGLPSYFQWRSRSGCYFCFYQQIGEWQRLKERHPELYEKAKKYEKLSGARRYTWIQGRSLEDVEKLQKEYPLQDMDDTEGCAICHL
jgi:3'-phosphoadenosine 5'-phosphosulfate sulfotransferase (PAPS reductase)/FAD synthetase